MSDPSNYSTILIANHQTNHEWSDEAKGAMIGMRMAGMSQRAVARVLKTDHKTVAAIEKRFTQTASVQNKPRIGRPQKLNRAQTRYVLPLIGKNPYIKWEKLLSEAQEPVCLSTLKHAVSFYYKRKWKAMDRLRISKVQAASRPNWMS
ncbi:hypothetical protein FOXB_00949 [Fusarium oxysporum f. sp. conglutinans Fo5176]|uniref:Transposase Tc1-like domain-containing protein n=1 Tax=Fusarium oxysporum (strain Fo5176) TaxID=660025 RepID=F9F3H4_FUSOF|nr:hypothetical protein FOXB_00949 [Fusarium oxysporum f. sp. conglutinans Fo5176]